ncbi:MAG: hypothetical protein AAF518_14370 [Spirochaetota bacterium]
MEILFMVWLVFSNNQTSSIQYHNFYLYSEKHGLADTMDCQSYIHSQDLQKKIRKQFARGDSARVGCVAASELSNLEHLLRSSHSWKQIQGGGKLRLQVPKTNLGKRVYPEERPLAEWLVYREKIRVPMTNLKQYDLDATLVEEAILEFFRYAYQGSIPKKLYATSSKPSIQKQIQQNLGKTKQIHNLLFYGKLPYAKVGNCKSNSFLCSLKAKKKVLEAIGEFDIVVFLETPPYKEDTFVFLKYEQGRYKIVAAVGLLHK